MGLLDRLFSFVSGGSGGAGAKGASASGPKARKPVETVYLAADEASSLGDVTFMRRSNTIRRTFPGTVNSPGTKEMVAEVASMEASLERVSEGLPGTEVKEVAVNLTGGVPKPVKKTFAQPMSQAELDQRKRGSSLGVNRPGVPAAAPKEQQPIPAAGSAPAATAPAASEPQESALRTAKPGVIDPFKQMARDLNN